MNMPQRKTMQWTRPVLRTLPIVLAAAALLMPLAGCQSGQSDEMTVPPPAYDPAATSPEGGAPADQGAVAVSADQSGDQAEAAPAPQPQPQPQTAGASTYTVQKNDTLWSIADRIYGDPYKHKAIQRANPGLNPQELRVGQTITLPPQ